MKIIYRAIATLGLAAILAQFTLACQSNSTSELSSESAPPVTQEKAATDEAETTTAETQVLSPPNMQPVPAASKLSPKTPQSSSSKSLNRQIPEESNQETYSTIPENPFLSTNSHPLSTFAIDVDSASYSNVRRFINQGQLPPPDAVRIEELINYFTYDYPQPKGNQPFSITTEVAEAPWNPKHKLVHIGLQGKKISTESLPASNLVFLLDVSGSMDEVNKLPLLKQSLRLLVDQLRDEDRVSIVVYAGAAGTVLPPTPGTQKDKILAALNQLQAGGSTAGGEGIKLAYKLAQDNFISSGNNRVILATDGDFNVGISSDEQLVQLIEEQREKGVFLTVLGFGTGNFQDGKMEKIANKGNGNYAYIDNILEANKVMVNEIGGTLLTIAKDVKIQVGFNPEKVQGYRLIGYENRRLENEAFADDKKDAGELGAGHSVTALYEIIPVGVKLDLPLSDVDIVNSQQKTDESMTFSRNELMQIKLRYKQPEQTTSALIHASVLDQALTLDQASNNFKFSASVAEFGMILRQSKYKGNSNLEQVLRLASESQGADLDGYRAEFIRLVKQAKD